MEMMTPVRTEVANSINLIWHPHPISPLVGRTDTICAIRPGATVRDVLKASAIDPHQPIMVTLDDRLLTVEEWDTVCPAHHQILNVKATVQGGGGGGGSNVLQVVALVAIVVVAAMLAAPTGGLSLQAAYGLTAAQAAGFAAAFAVAGSMLVNAVFAAQIPSTSMSSQTGQYSQGSPTYSLSGGSNRMRPYESMPVIMGAHRFFPDAGAKPYTEYHGEDQYLYQIFHLGLSNAAFSDWKIGTTPLSSYQEYAWHYPDQNGRIGAFPGNVDSVAGAELLNSAGWIYRSTSPDTYRIGIDIEGALYYANNAGGLDGTSVQLRIQYKPSNSSTWLEPSTVYAQGNGFVTGHYWTRNVWVESGYWEYYGDDWNSWSEWRDTSHYESRTDWISGSGGTVIISGASQSPKRATLFINVPTGTYDVRIIRDTSDSSDARLQNKTNWSTLRSYQADTANYVGQNRLGLTIRASEQLSGVVQQLSVMANANARYWNGSWQWGPTSNPAHWFMDFAIGRYDSAGKLTYGLGMPESQIDLAALNAWANFCAVEGLTFNAVLDDDRTAADMLTAIARCGFGSPTWETGKLGAVWDRRNASPSDAFGMSNIIKGSFEVNYITEQLAEEIIVRFTNPDKDWIQDEVRVTVPGIVNPVRSSTVDLYGCTSARMAGKFANYLAAQQKYRKRRISWDADFEGLGVGRGDVVLLSHDLTQWGYSGRIVEQVGNTLTLDRTVPRNGSLDYLMIKRPDGTLTTYRVKAASGDQHVVELTSTPNMHNGRLPMDHMWFFSPLATPGKKVKILSIQPISESRVKIVATDEEPQFYDAWDGSWSEAKKTTLLEPSTPVISGLQISERLSLIGTGQIVTRVTFSWQQQTSQLERVELRYRINFGPWMTASVRSGQSFDVDFDGYGLVEVSALPINGLFMGQAVTASAQVYGKTLPPQNVQAFTTDPLENRFTLRWNAVEDIDLAGYQIRWINGDSRDWGQAAPIHEGLIVSSPYISVVRPAGYGTLMIKAVDTSGNYSVTPAAIVLDLGDA
ncbi:MAG: host specificity factor TipJ family phage tail protein, partial [Fluviibacter sp.]